MVRMTKPAGIPMISEYQRPIQIITEEVCLMQMKSQRAVMAANLTEFNRLSPGG